MFANHQIIGLDLHATSKWVGSLVIVGGIWLCMIQNWIMYVFLNGDAQQNLSYLPIKYSMEY